MTRNIMIIHTSDNVGVALRNLHSGEQAASTEIDPFPVLEEIPASHKIALRDIPKGGEIVKYGETVAVSNRSIKKGEWVHTHNLESQKWKQ